MAAYCFDTSAFLEPWIRHYPMDVAPSLWPQFQAVIAAGRVTASIEVRNELQRKKDDLFKWVDACMPAWAQLDAAVQLAVREVMAHSARLIDTRSTRSGADPFVIATARATMTTVVSYENASRSEKRVRIPDVCDRMGIQHMGFVDFMRAEGIRL